MGHTINSFNKFSKLINFVLNPWLSERVVVLKNYESLLVGLR